MLNCDIAVGEFELQPRYRVWRRKKFFVFTPEEIKNTNLDWYIVYLIHVAKISGIFDTCGKIIRYEYNVMFTFELIFLGKVRTPLFPQLSVKYHHYNFHTRMTNQSGHWNYGNRRYSSLTKVSELEHHDQMPFGVILKRYTFFGGVLPLYRKYSQHIIIFTNASARAG